MRPAAQRGAAAAAPALFSFVTVRKEAMGGILFNPFLAAEIDLDDREVLMAALCTGAMTVEEIRRESQESLGLDAADAERAWAATLEKLERAAAVRFVRRRVGASQLPAGGRRGSPPPARAPAPPASRTPKSAIWDVTYACNLACPHCLTDSGKRRMDELDTEQAHAVIDVLAAAKVLYLSFSGGEPFIRPDLLDLVAHVADSGMRLDVATNGFEVPARIIRGLRRLPVFNIQVSVDGIGAQHDAFRGRKGSFERACRSLRLFKDEGFSTSISTTAHAANVGQLGRIVELAVQLGCDGFKAIPFIPSGRGRLNAGTLALDARACRELTRVLAAKSREHVGRIRISTDATFAFLLDPPPTALGADGRMICSAGHDQLSIGADGTAYPCPFLHDFPLGNLLRESMETIWVDAPVLMELRGLTKRSLREPCRSCAHAPDHCHGGCRASAYLATGSLAGSDPLCFAEAAALG